MVTAVMVLSHAAVGQMVDRGRGAIVNVGSIAALTAGGTYAAAKAWVRTFTDGLAVELAGTGVTATVIAPGLTRTEFHERGNLETTGLPSAAWLDPAKVVSQALADVRRGVVHSTPTRRYKAAAAVLRAAPRGAVRAMGATGLRRANETSGSVVEP
jgi:short-subunit dehydrogenase